MAWMSDEPPSDPPRRPLPWEPTESDRGQPPEPPNPSLDSGWTTPEPPPPSPTDPTTVWSPASPGVPPTPTPSPPAQGGLVSSAPVSWSPPPWASVEVAPGLAYADTTSRAVAYFVDLVILAIVGVALGSLLPQTTTRATDLNDLMSSSNPAGTVLAFLIDLAYFVIAWTGGRRATIGQRLFSIQVGNAFDGRSLSRSRRSAERSHWAAGSA